ncbi:MAG: GH32 C-terminal domain-containing protein [Planctomycetota bacterium]
MRTLALLPSVLLTLCSASIADDDILVMDFESESYAPWKVTGEAFGPGPAEGTLPGQMHVDGYHGKRLVNSFYRGDDTIGVLESPQFTIQRRYLTFLIGGGQNEKLALQLVVRGNVVRSSSGGNQQPGGSESLAPESWDLEEFLGQSAMIRVVDQATGGWGHINVDHIVLTDTKPKGLITNAERTFRAEHRYLHLPIRNGAPKRIVTLLVDGKPIVRNEIELADDHPDWFAPMEIAGFRGQEVTLRVDRLREDSLALSAVEQSDDLKDSVDLYQEPLRGQFHFSPRRGWNNDPNGLVFYNGEYHMFFQHNPYGWGWGNMHWGHAVSKDLVHWQELGDTLLPDDMGPMFSGSAVVDWNNTSGFGTKDQPPLVLIYTAAGNPTVQGLAYSTDGRNFTKYADNPILQEITGGNRDPKVMWHEPSKQWVMVLYVDWQKKHTAHFLTSPNLKDWKLASISEGDGPGLRFLYECPDFFELPIDGDRSRKKWILTAADSQYAIGSFDGISFHPEAERLSGHRGRGFYAAQTFSDIPASDGRRIQVGWFQTETRGMPFNQSMTLPLELRLMSTAEGPRLTFRPVKELESLRQKHHHIASGTLRPDSPDPLASINAELIELRTSIRPVDAKDLSVGIRGAAIQYDVARQELIVNDHKAPAPLRDGLLKLIIYCDRTGLEIFASDGLTYLPLPYQPRSEDRSLSVTTTGGSAEIRELHVYELKSAWTN